MAPAQPGEWQEGPQVLPVQVEGQPEIAQRFLEEVPVPVPRLDDQDLAGGEEQLPVVHQAAVAAPVDEDHLEPQVLVPRVLVAGADLDQVQSVEDRHDPRRVRVAAAVDRVLSEGGALRLHSAPS